MKKAILIVLRFCASIGWIGILTWIFERWIPVNQSTSGLVYLLAVLLTASFFGLGEAIAASITATLCWNFYFLPPVGTFTVADPQNWVALLSFLIAASIASKLSSNARLRTAEAISRRIELEQLYALSRSILLAEESVSVHAELVRHIAETFALRSTAIYDRKLERFRHSGESLSAQLQDRMKESAQQGSFFRDADLETVITAIQLGGAPIASLAIRGGNLSNSAVQAIASLTAIALERSKQRETASRAEAARQSGELKSTLLDAIAHEFKTPLTSIKAACTALLCTPEPDPSQQRELLSIVDEETDWLSLLVTEAIQTARVESGSMKLNPRPVEASSVVATALEHMRSRTQDRNIALRFPSNLPRIIADYDLATLTVRLVIENALKYTPAGSSLTIRGAHTGPMVEIHIIDQGPGIAINERSRVFEKFYRGDHGRNQITGSGMGLAIAREILEAHGGTIAIADSERAGTDFVLAFPVERSPETVGTEMETK